MGFDGTSVIVSGGAGGLGAAAVRDLVKAGARVVIADLNDEKGQELEKELGDAVRYVRTDVLEDESVQAALDAAAELGTLRYAVVAHGGFGGTPERLVGRDGSPASYEAFKTTIDIYLGGTYNMLRLAAAKIATAEPDDDGERGAIVTTASIAAYEGQIGQTPYAAAKGGVVSLTLAAARDLSAVGIRVCCIAPGTIKTPMMASVGEEALKKYGEAVPFPKRLGEPAEYAALATHLLSNPYMNGETVRIDGAQRFGPR